MMSVHRLLLRRIFLDLLPFNASSCIPSCMYRNPIISPSRNVFGTRLLFDDDAASCDAPDDEDVEDEDNEMTSLDDLSHLRCLWHCSKR